jgi:hypothetical protein
MSSLGESAAAEGQNKRIVHFFQEEQPFRLLDLLPFPWHVSFAIRFGAEGERRLIAVDAVLSLFSAVDCQPVIRDRCHCCHRYG